MKEIGSRSLRARGQGAKLLKVTVVATLATTLFAGGAACLAQGKPTAVDGPDLIQEVLDKAIAARVKPHPELKPFHGEWQGSVSVVTVSDRDFVLRMQLPNNSGVFHFHFIICKPDDATPAWVSDAVILGPLESAPQFYDDNLSTSLYTGSKFARCQTKGSEYTTVDGITESRTRILSHLGGLLRYFLQYKPNPRRGADLLKVAAIGWRQELHARDERRDLRDVSLGLHLIDRAFPFDLLDRTPLDPATRAASRELLTTTLFLRRKLSAVDEKAGAFIKRDEELLVQLGPP